MALPHHFLPLALALFTAVPALAQLRAGAARRDITPDLSSATAWIAGFGNNRAATAVEHPLSARCLALAAGARPVVLCGVDSIGLFHDDVLQVRRLAAEKHKLDAHIIVAATHVHQAPDTMGLWGRDRATSGIDENYNSLVVERTAEAAAGAAAAMAPAHARLARVDSTRLHEFFADTRPPRVLDSEILTLALDTPAGQRIATLVNWANHPEALGSKNTLITPDWPHYLYDEIESRAGGVAVFLNGALGGMMSPLGATVLDPATGKPAPPVSFRFTEIAGRAAASAALQSVLGGPPALIDAIEYRETMVSIPVSNKNFLAASAAGLFKGRKPITPEQGTAAPLGYLRLSANNKPVLEAACIPGELYPELSVGGIERSDGADFPGAPFEPAIKRDILTAPFRMVFGLANDEIGYIIPKAQWDEAAPFTFGAQKAWYGEINSPGPATAPAILDALVRIVRDGSSRP